MVSRCGAEQDVVLETAQENDAPVINCLQDYRCVSNVKTCTALCIT